MLKLEDQIIYRAACIKIFGYMVTYTPENTRLTLVTCWLQIQDSSYIAELQAATAVAKEEL